MNARVLIVTLAFLAAAGAALAQGFAGLGTDAEGYERVTPGRPFLFPRDHAPHPGYRIEWWYLTANLEDVEGNPYGIQWTLFRQALAPGPQREGWQNQQLWMGHAGLTSETTHRSAELFARGGIGQAGVAITPFSAWIDDWSLAATTRGDGALSDLRVAAHGEDFAYDLTLATSAAPVLQGDGGFSVKSEGGQASYYYSQPFFQAEGSLTIDGREIEVSGRAWMDREWSSQPLSSEQEGWDWFSLHLPAGDKLMLFRLRQSDGSAFYSGTWIGADGTTLPIAPGDILLEPLGETVVAGRGVPTRWRVEIESRGLAVETEPVNPESWMDTTFAYWEGPIRFSGSHDGVGYLEMTGYAAD